MKKWELLKELRSPNFAKASMGKKNQEVSIEEIIQILLSNRKIETKKEVDSFLHPRLGDVTAEAVGIDKKQLTKALKRIQKAIDDKEQIIIYGDYDVDGITASAILWETLFAMGAKVLPYIPHRVEEGYGLSIQGIKNILKIYEKCHPELVSGSEFGMLKQVQHDNNCTNVKLIVTVDNGIVANEAVDFANEQGIDVIITDHHTVGKELPKALAIVHTTKLCGAGIAWVLAREIKPVIASGFDKLTVNSAKQSSNKKIATSSRYSGTPRNDKVEDDNLLELAALGTIADLVPLTGANRAIVKYGLQKLCQTKRPGLLELLKEAGCDTSTLGVYEVGHIIAPRLNATGRMASAMDSLRLLCTKDRNRAEELASLLGVTNKERQAVMAEATKHAIDRIKNQELSIKYEQQKIKNILIAVHDSYQEGVIGLVAGRIVEEFYRPAIVISKGEKVSKGSVRSISGFNIIEFLRQSSEFFVNVGGHPMAAGFTVETDKLEKMQDALEKLAEAMDDGLFVRALKIDCELPLSMITDEFYIALQALEPFGMANPEPTFVSRNVKIEDMRVLGKEGKHLRLHVSQLLSSWIPIKSGDRISSLEGKDSIASPDKIGSRSRMTDIQKSISFEAIAFGMGERAKDLQIGQSIEIAYTVDENIWNGNRKLQLKVKDIIHSQR